MINSRFNQTVLVTVLVVTAVNLNNTALSDGGSYSYDRLNAVCSGQ